MRKFFFNALIYIGLIFLVVYLYQYDYLSIAALQVNPVKLVASTLLLWMGFLSSALSWQRALKIHGIVIPYKSALSSHGLSVFAKFIPGKIWVILGRASKVSLEGHSLKMTSFVSLKEQLVYIWLGLLLSLAIIFGPTGTHGLIALVLVLIIGLTLFNFSGWLRRLAEYLFQLIFKREFIIPPVTFTEALPMTRIILLYWALWSSGFYLFVSAISPSISPLIAFVFPLSVTLGLIAVIVPGGLGVREGIITLGLTTFGVPIELATTIAIAARLWFTSGEVFIFLSGLWASKHCKEEYGLQAKQKEAQLHHKV